MQFIFFYIISLSCLYSLVISASIDQNFQDTKHEKASAIANHLLKELANEQIQSDIKNHEDDIEYSDPIYDDSSLETTDFDDFLPFLDEESESNEDFIPMKQTSIMDDSIMKTENH